MRAINLLQRKDLLLSGTHRRPTCTGRKTPVVINQFGNKLDKQSACLLFHLLCKYKCYDHNESKRHGRSKDHHDSSVMETDSNFFPILKRQVKLVLIATDAKVELLAHHAMELCIQHNIPYLLINSRYALGTIIRKESADLIYLSEVNSRDTVLLSKIIKMASNNQSETAYEVECMDVDSDGFEIIDRISALKIE